ncbi:unnamed protein product [Gongylonema pulchrum]|uniref:Ion_trans domain-containing protein n=1 Tax=Gongylonema pulchrum TaxID=637853 RepID=A0A183EH43_9BILA|nr:unnamed protein product [Gongylonema pulchrum]
MDLYKYVLQASQELQKAIEDEQRRKKERQNTKCLQLTQKKWFDYTILLFIAINCITLAMERPSIPPKSLERQFLSFTGYVFTVIFTIEMTMKVCYWCSKRVKLSSIQFNDTLMLALRAC